MATSINFYPQSGKLYLSSVLDIINIVSDREKVEIAVDVQGDQVFSSILFPFDNLISIYDLHSLVIGKMNQLKISVADVRISADEAEIALKVLFNSALPPATFDPECSFWMSDSNCVAHPASYVILNGKNLDSIQCHFHGKDSEGRPTSFVEKPVSAVSTNSVKFEVSSLIEQAKQNGIENLSYCLIENADASACYVIFIVPHPEILSFRFRNQFNAYEQVDIPCIWTVKTSVSSDMLISAGKAIRIDKEKSRVFQIETAQLPECTLRAIEQLILSTDVSLSTAFGLEPVVIPDPSYEFSTDPEASNKIKFSFRFQRQGVVYHDRDMVPEAVRIFSEQFSNPFA